MVLAAPAAHGADLSSDVPHNSRRGAGIPNLSVSSHEGDRLVHRNAASGVISRHHHDRKWRLFRVGEGVPLLGRSVGLPLLGADVSADDRGQGWTDSLHSSECMASTRCVP